MIKLSIILILCFFIFINFLYIFNKHNRSNALFIAIFFINKIMLVGYLLLFIFSTFSTNGEHRCKILNWGKYYDNLCTSNLNNYLNPHHSRDYLKRKYSLNKGLYEMTGIKLSKSLTELINFEKLNINEKDELSQRYFISSVSGFKIAIIGLALINIFIISIIKIFKLKNDYFHHSFETARLYTAIILLTIFLFLVNRIFGYTYSYVIDIFIISFVISITHKLKIYFLFILLFISIFFNSIIYSFIIFFSIFLNMLNYKFDLRYLIKLSIIILISVTFFIFIIFYTSNKANNLGGHIKHNFIESLSTFSLEKIYVMPLIGELNVKYKNIFTLEDVFYSSELINKMNRYELCFKGFNKSWLPNNNSYIKEVVNNCVNYKPKYDKIFSVSNYLEDKIINFFKFYNLYLFSNRIIGIAPRIIFEQSKEINKDNINYKYYKSYKENYLKNFFISISPIHSLPTSIQDSEFIKVFNLNAGTKEGGNSRHAETIYPFTDLYMMVGYLGFIIFAILFAGFYLFCLKLDSLIRTNIFKSLFLVLSIYNIETNSLIFFSSFLKYVFILLIFSLIFKCAKSILTN